MKRNWWMLLLLIWLLTACQGEQPACSWDDGQARYLETLPASFTAGEPGVVRIGHRDMSVDQVVSGPLCNAHWSGTVYVTCDVQVLRWQEQPLFLQDCDLTIEPGTVVYVAWHNDAAYYNSCSCHTGEIPAP